MARINHLVFACRLAQISSALIALSVTIAICKSALPDHDFKPSPNGYLMTAGAFSCGNIMLLGALGLFALHKPDELSWYMVLVSDSFAFAFSIAAGTCFTYNAIGYYMWYGNNLIAVVFGYLCMLPICICMLRTWQLAQQRRTFHPKLEYASWHASDARPPQYTNVVELERTGEQLEAHSIPATRWSTTSDAVTLGRKISSPSARQETKPPPAYESRELAKDDVETGSESNEQV